MAARHVRHFGEPREAEALCLLVEAIRKLLRRLLRDECLTVEVVLFLGRAAVTALLWEEGGAPW